MLSETVVKSDEALVLDPLITSADSQATLRTCLKTGKMPREEFAGALEAVGLRSCI
jgi:hypothetical protein